MKLLTDRTWHRRGMTVLWDPEALTELGGPAQATSIRSFLRLGDSWPETLAGRDGRSLVVAGIDSGLAALSLADAHSWLEEDLAIAVEAFARHFNYETALIFWIPDGRSRIRPTATSDDYAIHLEAKTDRMLWVGRDLFPGKAGELHRILDGSDRTNDPGGPAWKGLWTPWT